ncbi:protein no-on-transient A-like [Schistocerca piceifrons]|uniref:protein no-on-transient A-like n=1 Tax=Schistocerca piceifrons TaxID=274613 RepID=UPI001F5EA4EC|nr:protein no-on-transient A-like [Schistocerca piceifrons]
MKKAGGPAAGGKNGAGGAGGGTAGAGGGGGGSGDKEDAEKRDSPKGDRLSTSGDTGSSGSGGKPGSATAGMREASLKLLALTARAEWPPVDQAVKALEKLVAAAGDDAYPLPLAGLMDPVNTTSTTTSTVHHGTTARSALPATHHQAYCLAV